MRWLNNGGWTTEIIAWPNPDHWEWRLSVADIERGGPFSVFPDVDRTIALIRGQGFALAAGHSTTTITQPYEPFEFDGGGPTDCTLVDGSVQDLNLMVRRSSTPRHLRFVEVVETLELIDIELAVVVSGEVLVDGHNLSRLDAIRAIGGPLTVKQTSISHEATTIAVVI
jgi:uncharacterized protein